jgi:hypothetical protein
VPAKDKDGTGIDPRMLDSSWRRKVYNKRIFVRNGMACVLITGLFVLGVCTPAMVNVARAGQEAAGQNPGPSLLIKGFEMTLEAMKKYGEKKDVAGTRTALAENCKLMVEGRDLIMKDEKLMNVAERLTVGPGMMVSGGRMVSYGLKMVADNRDASEANKLMAEGESMMKQGKKLLDEGLAKASARK